MHNNFETALELHEKGYLPVAILPGLKVPAERWTRWLTEEMTQESITRRWQFTRNGIAVICRGFVVFDVDDANELDFVIDSTGLKNAPICKTPRGGYHLHARVRSDVVITKKTKVKGREIDVLAADALSHVPPSLNEKGVPYEWIGGELPAIAELPYARIGWTRERAKKVVITAAPEVADHGSMLWRGQRYVDTFPEAIEGEGGHRTTFIAAAKIARFVNKDADLAWQLLLYYNARKCRPEWSESALRHKWKEGLKYAR